MIWTMTGAERPLVLVFRRGWTPDRYEDWLGTALIDLLLSRRTRTEGAHLGSPEGQPVPMAWLRAALADPTSHHSAPGGEKRKAMRWI